MEAGWIDEGVTPYRHGMDFMAFYGKLKLCFDLISEEEMTTRQTISAVIRHVFDDEPIRDNPSSPQDDSPTSTWDERLQHTYRHLDMGCEPHAIHLPLRLNRKRDILYKACIGYIPKRDQLPRQIQLARALAMNLPPPNLPALALWKCLDLCPLEEGNGIVVNTAIPDKTGIREFRVMDARGLLDFCTHEDWSAGEVFSSDMWCTAITFDIDGKTCDALQFGASSCYPLSVIQRELMAAMHSELLLLTQRKWDIKTYPPPIHVWMPEEVSCKKLSMRISVHFPSNVCFQSISDVSTFVQKVCQNLRKIRAQYLILRYVQSGGIKFEKSHMDNLSWCGLNSRGERVSLEDTINKLSNGETMSIQICDGHVDVTRNQTDGHVYVTRSSLSSPHRIQDVSVWIHHEIGTRALEECLVDSGVYHHNKSLRLPHQSKIEGGNRVRKFLPITKKSTVLDALMHYTHTDMPSIPGSSILMRYTPNNSYTLSTTYTRLTLEKAKELILSRYNMSVTKVTERDGKAYLDVNRMGDSTIGGGNYCLIKGDMHSSARMFFVLGNSGMLSFGCWSAKCKRKSVKAQINVKQL